MTTTLEAEIDLRQRLKAARRIDLATASVLRTCGVKVTTARPPKPSVARNNVYRIDGHEGDIIGVDGLRGWLWDHGVRDASHDAVRQAASRGTPFRGFMIRLVGTMSRSSRAVKFANPEAL